MTDSTKKRSRGRSSEKGNVSASLGRPPQRHHVTVKPHSYQPSKAELEEPMKIDATPEELARRALRPMKVIEDPDA